MARLHPLAAVLLGVAASTVFASSVVAGPVAGARTEPGTEPYVPINTQRWSSYRDWLSGSRAGVLPLPGPRTGLIIGRPAGTTSYLDPHTQLEKTWEYATWTSPVKRLDPGATQLVASWNARTPAGTWLQVDMVGTYSTGERTPWYVMGRWAFGDGDIKRTTVPDQEDAHSFIDVDTFSLNVRRAWPAIVTAAMPGIGMLLYSGYLYLAAGEPFIWLQAHQAWGRVYEGVGGLFTGHYNLMTEIGIYQYTQSQPFDVVNGSAAVLALLLVLPVALRVGLAYALLILLMTLPPLAAGGFLSMGRVTSTLFPLFLYAGWQLRGANRSGVVVACAIFQGFFAALYYTWRPLF